MSLSEPLEDVGGAITTGVAQVETTYDQHKHTVQIVAIFAAVLVLCFGISRCSPEPNKVPVYTYDVSQG